LKNDKGLGGPEEKDGEGDDDDGLINEQNIQQGVRMTKIDGKSGEQLNTFISQSKLHPS